MGLVALLASAAALAARAGAHATRGAAASDCGVPAHRSGRQNGEARRLTRRAGTGLLRLHALLERLSTALHQLRELEREHRAALGKTRIVIISVDGERDSPQAMQAWLKPLSANFIGLTGAPARVHNIAADFSAAFFKQPQTAPGEYQLQHNSQIFLVDAQGRLRATFFNAPVATMAEVTRAVAVGP